MTVVTDKILDFFSKRIDISKTFLNFCKEFSKMDLTGTLYVIKTCVKYRIKNFINVLDIFRDDANILKIYKLTQVIEFENEIHAMHLFNCVGGDFSLKLDLFLIHQNLYREKCKNNIKSVMYPIHLLELYSETSSYVIIEYINFLLKNKKNKMALNFKKAFDTYLFSNVEFYSHNYKTSLIVFENISLDLIKKNVMYYPTSLITNFLIQKYFENKEKSVLTSGNIDEMKTSEKGEYLLKKYSYRAKLSTVKMDIKIKKKSIKFFLKDSENLIYFKNKETVFKKDFERIFKKHAIAHYGTIGKKCTIGESGVDTWMNNFKI